MHNPFYNNYEANKDNIKKIARNADEIWVSTNGLKETFSEFNKNIKVIPNAHNDYLFPVKNKIKFNDKVKNVAYRGGSTHEIDVYSQLNDWIEMINKNKTTEFYFMGSRFPYLESRCGDNYVIIPGTHILDYFRNMHKVNPSMFIYTLEDSKFNRGKSNISWIEATYSGAAVIAPEFLPEFIRPGISNFTSSLKQTFDRIKKDTDLLKTMNDLSWEYIQAKLLLSHVNQQRYNSIVEVKNRK
jgi:hypothetical protein